MPPAFKMLTPVVNSKQKRFSEETDNKSVPILRATMRVFSNEQWDARNKTYEQ